MLTLLVFASVAIVIYFYIMSVQSDELLAIVLSMFWPITLASFLIFVISRSIPRGNK